MFSFAPKVIKNNMFSFDLAFLLKRVNRLSTHELNF